MKHTLFLLFFVAAASLSAQDWIARYSTGQYHDDSGRALAVDWWGNSYVAGYADPKGIVVIKYNPQGETLWMRTVTKNGYSDFGCMGATIGRDGNLFVAQLVRSGTLYGFHILRYGPNGACLFDTAFWHTNVSGQFPGYPSYPVCVAVDATGSFYVCGTTQAESTSWDMVTCRFTQDGSPRWTRFFDGQRHDVDKVGGTALDPAGAVLVAGTTIDASNHLDAVVLKYDSMGTLLWTYAHRPNTNYQSTANSVVASDSGVYVAGTSSNGSLVLRLTSNGDSVWSRDDSGSAAGLVADSSGSILVGGGWSFNYKTTMRLWKYDRAGQRHWRRDYIGTDTCNTGTHFVLPGGNQTVYLVGARNPGALRDDYMVAKYDSAGTKVWSAFGGDSSDNLYEVPSAAAVDRDGNIILTGASEYAGSSILTMKFRASGAVEEQPATPIEAEHVIMASPSVVFSRCRFSIPGGGKQSTLSIADITGRMVHWIPVPTGVACARVSVMWDTKDEQGRPVPNGVYFVTLASGSTRASCKLIVQR